MTNLKVGLPLIDGREYELLIEGQVSDHQLGDGSGVVALSPRVPGKGPELWMRPKKLHLHAANTPMYIDGPSGEWTDRQRQSDEPSVYLQSIDPFTDKALVAMFGLESDPGLAAITSLLKAWAIVNGQGKKGQLTGRPVGHTKGQANGNISPAIKQTIAAWVKEQLANKQTWRWIVAELEITYPGFKYEHVWTRSGLRHWLKE